MFSYYLVFISILTAGIINDDAGSLSKLDAEIEAAGFIGHFIDEMNIYGSTYDSRTRFDLEEELLVGPTAILASELPGLEQEQVLARSYFRILRENQMRIIYSDDFTIVHCSSSSGPAYGAIVHKIVITPGQTTYNYQDFIELTEAGNRGFRVRAIYSSRFPSFSSLECRDEEQATKLVVKTAEETQACPFFTDAERAYKTTQFAQALLYYERALECGKKTAYIEGRIAELSSAATLRRLIEEAAEQYRTANFQRALQLFEAALQYDLSFLDLEEAYVQEHINQCKTEIAYREQVDAGDYHFQRGNYDKALSFFEAARQLKPEDSALASNINFCRTQIARQYQEKIQQEIAAARNRIERQSDYEKALITLMKYDDSGLIDGKLFFYMAQIMDGCYREVKKAYDLKSMDCCILAKRYLIKARNLGYQSDDLDDIWTDHFNKNSRTCGK